MNAWDHSLTLDVMSRSPDWLLRTKLAKVASQGFVLLHKVIDKLSSLARPVLCSRHKNH